MGFGSSVSGPAELCVTSTYIKEDDHWMLMKDIDFCHPDTVHGVDIIGGAYGWGLWLVIEVAWHDIDAPMGQRNCVLLGIGMYLRRYCLAMPARGLDSAAFPGIG